MISSLFFLKFNVRRLTGWLIAALLLGVASVFAYTPAPLEALRYVRGELLALFDLMGVRGDSTLSTFALGYLFGLPLPLFVSVYAVHANRRLISLPMEDGRMAMLIASGHRRAAILMTHAAALALSVLMILLSVFIGQVGAALAFSLDMDLLSFLRLHAGFGCVSLLTAFICLLIAVRSADDLRMARASRFFVTLMLLAMALSRLPGRWAGYLRYLSAWSLFDGTSLAYGSGGFESALAALAAGALCLVLSLIVYERREL